MSSCLAVTVDKGCLFGERGSEKRRRKNFIPKRDMCHGMDTDVEAPRRRAIFPKLHVSIF